MFAKDSFSRHVLPSARPALVGLAALCGDAAGAQEAADTVDEIIVTATKRDEHLHRVPASISVLLAEDLNARQIQTIEALSHNIPNVAYTMVAAVVPNFSIRGVSADGGSPIMEGTVALHIDGAYQPRVNMLELAMADLQSAEVLRGPQGTLYGRNANAGVINLNTKRPTEEFEASITVSAGSYDRYGARAHVSGPITPQLSVRASVMLDQSNGHGRNLLLNTDVSGYENTGGRLSLRWKPSDELTVDLIGSYSRSVQDQPFYAGNPFGTQGGSNYSLLVASGADGRYSLAPYQVYNNFDPEQSAHQDTTTAIVDWELHPNFSLKSITSYQDYSYRSLQDHDATPTHWIIAAPRAHSTTLSQEMNASAILGDATVIAGAYYLDDDLDGGVVIEIPPGNPFGTSAAPRLLTSALISQRSVSAAIFADLTYSVSEHFRILAGARQTQDQRETVQRIESARNASFSDPGIAIAGCTLNHPVPDIDFDSTTGKLGAQLDIAPQLMGYVTWQSGFKAGAFSSTICDNQFLPEEVSSWEVGVKGRHFQNRLTLNLVAFYYDYTNMQLARTFNPTPTTISQKIDNAASATLWGGEIEALANFNDAWRADLAVGYVHSEYGPLEARNGAVPGNPNVVLTGKQLPRSPEWTMSSALEYATNLEGLGDLTVRAQYNYTSRIYFTPFNEPIARQGSYGLLDVTASFEPLSSNLLFRVFGRNLTDEAYFNGLFTSAISNNGRGSYGWPRTFGIELTAGF
jgi:iron complex outermembrane recepter protein